MLAWSRWEASPAGSMMNMPSTDALTSDPDAVAVLLRLAELSASISTDQWVSRLTVGEGLGLPEEDVLDHLTTLTAYGLARNSERLSSGWRISSAGRRLAEQLRISRTSGRERYEHTMRQILRIAVEEEDGDFLRDEWEAWDLHAPGLPEVPLMERESAMDALEEQELISSIHSSGASHVRCEVTAKGRMMLGRPDISLADAHLVRTPVSTTTYDQRVGIRADTFTNQGAVQIGDHATQHVTITNDQRRAVFAQLDRIRQALQDPDLPADVAEPVSEAVEKLEQELGADQPAAGRLRELREKALTAAAGALGTEAGRSLTQMVVDLSKFLPLG